MTRPLASAQVIPYEPLHTGVKTKNMETSTQERLLITVEEAAKLMSLGRTMIYELINNENLPVHRFKSAVRISPAELQAWINERNEGKAS